MYDSSGIFRISPHPLYILQLIDCKYFFLQARRQEEARRVLALLDLWRIALWAFFPARQLVLRDQLLWECRAFLPFLEWLLIIPFFLFLSKCLEKIIHLLRLSFISFTGCSLTVSRKCFFCSFLNVWRRLTIYCVYHSSLLLAALGGFPENLLRLYQTNLLFYLVSSFYSSGKCHHL